MALTNILTLRFRCTEYQVIRLTLAHLTSVSYTKRMSPKEVK
jgi:hypothetical protein